MDRVVVTMSLVVALLLTGSAGFESNGARKKPDPAAFLDAQRSGAALNREQALQPGSSPPAIFPGDPSARIIQQAINNPGADSTAADTQSETTVAVSGSNVVIGWNDSGSITGDNNQLTGYGASTNGGTSFTDKGVLPASTEGDAGDPVLAAGPGGVMYLSTLGFVTGARIQVFKSTNGGSTFGAPVNGTPGFGGSGDFQDKQWLVVDNSPGSGRGNVYLCWTRFGATGAVDIRLTRSTNGGTSFGPSRGLVLSNGGQGCNVVVGPDHSVYVFYYRGTDFGGFGGDNKLFMRKSTNLGMTFAAEVPVADLVTTSVAGELGLAGGFRTNSFPTAAVAPNGSLYVVYNDNPTDTDNGDIFIVRSLNGGTTWSPPAQVNDDDAGRDQYMPAIAISPNGALLMVGYYSRANDPTNSAFHRRGRIGTFFFGTPVFKPSFQLGPDTPVAIGQDPVINPTYMGDYDQIAASPGAFHTSWADNRSGNRFHANQPDVHYARVALPPASTNLSLSLSEGADPVATGSNLTYRVAVTNTGSTTAQDVFVHDALPTGVAPKSAVAAGGSCDLHGQLVGCHLGAVAPGATRTLDIVAVAVSEGSRTNTASLTTSSTDTSPSDNRDQVVTTVVGEATSTTYSSGDIARPIRDLSTVEIPLAVPEQGVTLDVIARVRLNHTFDADLVISLVSPNGRVVVLSSNNGGSADNFGTGPNSCAGTPTAFNDNAPTSIIAGTAPFAGRFRPEQALSTLAGDASDGEWKLRVADVAGADVGTVGCVELVIKRP